MFKSSEIGKEFTLHNLTRHFGFDSTIVDKEEMTNKPATKASYYNKKTYEPLMNVLSNLFSDYSKMGANDDAEDEQINKKRKHRIGEINRNL
jgi:hypothetical protein